MLIQKLIDKFNAEGLLMKKSGFRWSNNKCIGLLMYLLLFLFAGANTASAEGGGIEVFPDVSLFVQIVNFIILIIALNVIVYKPIRAIITQRKEKITGLEQSIGSLNDESMKRDESVIAGIKDANAKGLERKEVFIQEAAEQEKSIIEKINENAQANLKEVREKIEKDTEKARVSLQEEIDAFADEIGQKILGRAI